MRKLELKKIVLRGFKSYKEEKIFDISHFTQVLGENGEGKSTFGEAIAWALYGCNIVGNDKADSLLMNKDSIEMTVALTFLLDHEDHTVVRIRKKSSDIFYDGEKVSQAKLTSILGIEKDIFLTIFNPQYFLNKNAMDCKNLLNTVLPRISKEDILNNMIPYDSAMISKDNFFNANLYLKELRDNIKEIEEGIIFSEGSISAKEQDLLNLVIPEKQEFDDTKLTLYELELEQLLSEKPKYIDISSLKEEKLEIEKQIFKLRNKKYDLQDTSILEGELKSLQGKANYFMSQLENKKFESGDICPTCGQEISEEHLELVEAEILVQLEEVTESIDELNETIKLIQSDNEVTLLELKEETNKEIEELQEVINSLNIEEVEYENRKIMQEFNNTLGTRKVELKNLLAEQQQKKEQILRNNMQVDIALDSKIRIKDEIVRYQADIINQKKQLDELNQKVDAIKKYNTKLVEMQQEYIKPYVNKLSIQFEKVSKATGEIKDCFNIFYDGKEYKLLSTSEKIRAGLEIVGLITNYVGISLPVFIDNAEGITHYIKPQNQIIEAKVVKDQPLQIIA